MGAGLRVRLVHDVGLSEVLLVNAFELSVGRREQGLKGAKVRLLLALLHQSNLRAGPRDENIANGDHLGGILENCLHNRQIRRRHCYRIYVAIRGTNMNLDLGSSSNMLSLVAQRDTKESILHFIITKPVADLGDAIASAVVLQNHSGGVRVLHEDPRKVSITQGGR